jgi:hypothetical protein
MEKETRDKWIIAASVIGGTLVLAILVFWLKRGNVSSGESSLAYYRQ